MEVGYHKRAFSHSPVQVEIHSRIGIQRQSCSSRSQPQYGVAIDCLVCAEGGHVVKRSVPDGCSTGGKVHLVKVAFSDHRIPYAGRDASAWRRKTTGRHVYRGKVCL